VRIRISIVSYLNSKPFARGLSHAAFTDDVVLSYDHPSACAARLISGEADAGLVPVASIPLIPDARIISEYCIAADGRVDSVLLLSNEPLEQIRNIYTDAQSMTSVQLAKILAEEYWKTDPVWLPEKKDTLKSGEAIILIGDRAMENRDRYRYSYDLAAAWKEFTGLPFVFACWVANRELPETFIEAFNQALESGIKEIDRLEGLNEKERYYLNNIISYRLDEEKKEGMNLFLKMSAERAGRMTQPK
jgi:chorismate dehydratase